MKNNMKNKICTKCKKEKNVDLFHKDKRQKYGVRPECKSCDSFRPSKILKDMKWRVLNNENYIGMKLELTQKDIFSLADICCFCKKQIDYSPNVHRINKKSGYLKGNVAKTHKSCHQSHHAKEMNRNSKGQFTKKGGD